MLNELTRFFLRLPLQYTLFDPRPFPLYIDAKLTAQLQQTKAIIIVTKGVPEVMALTKKFGQRVLLLCPAILLSLFAMSCTTTNRNPPVVKCHDDNECVQSIYKKITSHWSRPASARNHMVAVLRITTNPDGKITSVTLTKSSGDKEYDQSTVEAVERSNPLSELEGLPRAIYKARFSTFHLTFDPEDLGQGEPSGATDT